MKQYVKYFITISMVIVIIIEFGVILINGVDNIGIPEIIILIILLVIEFYILIFFYNFYPIYFQKLKI